MATVMPERESTERFGQERILLCVGKYAIPPEWASMSSCPESSVDSRSGITRRHHVDPEMWYAWDVQYAVQVVEVMQGHANTS